jgi:hypothetical protein
MKKLFYVLTIALFAAGAAYASFPVNNAKQAEKQITVETASANAIAAAIDAEVAGVDNGAVITSLDDQKSGLDEKMTLILLWFFVGSVAAHRWYAGKPAGMNILYIITAGGCGIWAIIDLINIITDKF